MVVIHRSKTCGHVVAIVCARMLGLVLGYDGGHERFDEEIGMGR
jgi:hypothetical protein